MCRSRDVCGEGYKMSWMAILEDVEFDDYGDFEIQNNDIATVTDQTLILRQNIIDRIKTAFGDYYLYPSFGADLQSFIGKPVSIDLEGAIRNKIVDTLTHDGLVLFSELNIATFSDVSTVLCKIEIPTTRLISSDDMLSIGIVFNSITGSIYAN
jgi:phage baseplate assembly protein W